MKAEELAKNHKDYWYGRIQEISSTNPSLLSNEIIDHLESQLEAKDKEIRILSDGNLTIMAYEKYKRQLSEQATLMREYPAKFRKMQEEIDRLRKLLKVARCTNLNCDQKGAVQIAYDEWMPCEWCHDKNELLPPETLTICAECEEAKEGAYCGA